MYKYIKGTQIISEEKMLTSSEIAEKYNLWLPLTNCFSPNGELIDFVIKAYIERKNLKVSEYFYIDKYKCFKVYPDNMIEQIMKEFISYLKESNIVKSKDTIYSMNGIDFIYYKKSEPKGDVVNIQQYKKKKGEKK